MVRMVNIKVFVGSYHGMLYSVRGLKKPSLIGYVYEYETNKDNAEYWNSMTRDEQEELVGEAQMNKKDLRSVLRERRKPSINAPLEQRE